MTIRAKIAEFKICASEELATLANDNQPPVKAERVQRLIEWVLGPIGNAATRYGCDRPLNEAERRVIHYVIDFEADGFGVIPRLITLAVEITFDVDNIAELRAAQFEPVMRFLVDMLDWSEQ